MKVDLCNTAKPLGVALKRDDEFILDIKITFFFFIGNLHAE